ncbi:MAG: hypothetical protein MRJ96_00270 [Nitrospirales bacterium]|nr:hypothetical protein [Nitrospira sp.]MDR4499874.1 hypothetical protein [Nitrospirales bacterium]
MTDLKPLALDPKTLEEKSVQKNLEWVSLKSTDNLKAMLAEAREQPTAYHPEVMEAVQRILAERGELAYSPTKGKKFPGFFDQKVKVRLPDGHIQIFHSHAALRNAILEETVTKDMLARSLPNFLEEIQDPEGHQQPPWAPLQEFAKSKFTLASLYVPLYHYTKWGFLLGAYVASYGWVQHLLAMPHGLEHLPASIEESLSSFLSFILIGFVIFGYQGNIRRKDGMFIGSLYLLSVMMDVGFAGGSDQPDVSPYDGYGIMAIAIIHLWIFAFVFNGIIWGGTLGAIIGNLSGHVTSRSSPRAPDAIPEDTSAYRMVLLYAAMVMLFIWPLVYFGVFPWLVAALPIPS